MEIAAIISAVLAGIGLVWAGYVLGSGRKKLDPVENRVEMMHSALNTWFATVQGQLGQLAASEAKLQTETTKLAGALNNSQMRGMWGQVQLRRVVELAGMVEHVDFEEEFIVETENGTKRPDMIVKLPGNKVIPVDSKAPMQSYLRAVTEEDPQERAKWLALHAKAVREHIASLSSKQYWALFPNAPDFVAMFLPAEPLLGVALEQDPAIFDFAASKRVILVTPSTLLGLLYSAAYGWKQQVQADNIEEIASLGGELYDRAVETAATIQELRTAIVKVNETFNSVQWRLDKRLFVSARKLQAKTGSNKGIKRFEEV